MTAPAARAATDAVGGGSPASLGLAACTALVVGNMVGSGFFLAPAALAPYGAVAIFGWLVMAVGAICLGLVFARLARLIPATGGPYAYTRLGFGNFAGFVIAWGYWISIWVSLPAIAAALVGYLGVLVPALRERPLTNLGIALGTMWLVTAVNLRGVRHAGTFAMATVYTKLVPFLSIALIGLFWVDWGAFIPVNPTEHSFLTALTATAPLTMFAFLGLESATVPAGDVLDPRRTIPRATVLGLGIATLVYVLGTLVVMGVLPREHLLHSSAPFSDAARVMWGSWAGTVVAVAAIISSLGALNGWTLMLAQVPMAAARDGTFPSLFGQLSPKGVPARGLVLSMSLASGLFILQVSGSTALIALYDFLVDLSTDAAMLPYVFCCFVEAILFLGKHPASRARRIGPYMPIAIVAFLFSMWTIFGAGPEAGMWGLILILLGLPFYVYLRASDLAQERGSS